MPETAPRSRLSIIVEGHVQGVGFRPFVHRLATARALDGFVRNRRGGVHCEVEGSREQTGAFLDDLRRQAPGAARIDAVRTTTLAPTGERGFSIRPSDEGDPPALTIPLDAALCAQCQDELFDPANRRFRHPFISCTACGPRWSLLDRLPFDRVGTAMAAFPMCEQCRREYEDPQDRRFHAQTQSCPDCGPQLALWSSRGNVLAQRADALKGAIAALRRGEILAVKGLGGFHLMVDARNVEAITRLRLRKGRPHKPLAVMFCSIEAIEAHCAIDADERVLLGDGSAPIVLLPARGSLPAELAPGNPYIGAMLAYTPLHQLLLHDFDGPLVATSGNLGGEPLCHDEREVVERLDAIADCFLVHDRPILHPVDDSVAMLAAGRPLVLRCARGLAPMPLRIDAGPEEGGAILAVGGQLKNTISLGRGGEALVSPHLGDLGSVQADTGFQRLATILPGLVQASLATMAHDHHPDYRSTRYAQASALARVEVQHHHAHVAAVMAEHGLDGEVLGLAWDGIGLGTDGVLWGGEFLLADRVQFRRVASLREFPLPGGERVMREPRRSAQGVLHEAGLAGGDGLPWLSSGWLATHEQQLLEGMLRTGVNCPRTSSVGRLFDAVAALLGLEPVTSFEGQAAMALQFAAERHCGDIVPLPFLIDRGQTPVRVDWAPMITALLDARRQGQTVEAIAARFHLTLALVAVTLAQDHPEVPVVLAGGCFQNRLLLDRTIKALRAAGRQVFWPLRLPPNDGALSLGQLTVARARRRIAACA